jgi:hypothetical protein
MILLHHLQIPAMPLMVFDKLVATIKISNISRAGRPHVNFKHHLPMTCRNYILQLRLIEFLNQPSSAARRLTRTAI